MPLLNPVLRLGRDGSTRGEADGSPRSPLAPCRGVFQESDILGFSGQLTTAGGILFLRIVGGGLVPYIVCEVGLCSQVALG